MSDHVLIVDDEDSILKSLQGLLKDEGFRVSLARSGSQAIQRVDEEIPDCILLDIWMQDMDGMEALKLLKEKYQHIPIIMMSGHGNIETAVKATKLGAFDFLEKPLAIEKVLLTINHVLDLRRLEEENRQLRQKFEKRYEIIGNSPAILEMKEQTRIVAPTNSWVLITGENGTGKELVARNVHRQSMRKDKPFVEVNCAAIPEELIESELFGHEKGSFTGAASKKLGKFDLANGGTLFLDEIADMSLKTQAKILRILQEQQFERGGGSGTIHVDVRLLAATNKDLEEQISLGTFREDLYYRINVIPLAVPSLRERKDDIPELAKFFLKEFAAETGVPVKDVTKDAMNVLKAHHWPGNVRELRNVIERLVIMTPSSAIEIQHLPPYLLQKPKSSQLIDLFETTNLKEARNEFEREYLKRRLMEFGGNVSKTADAIGIERSNLHRKIKHYGIELSK